MVNDQLWWWGGPKCSTGGPASGLALNSSQSTVKFKPKFILQLNSIPNLCSAHQSAPCKGKLNIQYATIRSVGKQKAPLFCFDFVKSLWRDTWYFVLQGKIIKLGHLHMQAHCHGWGWRTITRRSGSSKLHEVTKMAQPILIWRNNADLKFQQKYLGGTLVAQKYSTQSSLKEDDVHCAVRDWKQENKGGHLDSTKDDTNPF